MEAIKRIVIADRSVLAMSLYRLLFSRLNAILIMRKRFEEARPHFFRRETVHLGVFNSNIFGKRFEDIIKRFREDEPLRKAPKIFVCRENIFEGEWRKELMHLHGASIVTRPFHPDEFLELVRRKLEGSSQ